MERIDFVLREDEEEPRRAAHTTVLLIQSGHTFLQIILLIIPAHSIAALNQAELWVHSFCQRLDDTARSCDSQREHHLTTPTLSVSVSSFFFLLYMSMAHSSIFSNQLSPDSLYSLYLYFGSSTFVTTSIFPYLKLIEACPHTDCSRILHVQLLSGFGLAHW